MNHDEVRRILTPVTMELNAEHLKCNPDGYVEGGGIPGYIHIRAGERMGTLDGDFSADQLEAIAYWMRHPEEFVTGGPITEYQMECETEERAQEAVETMPGLEVWSRYERKDKPISHVKEVKRHGTQVCIRLVEPVTVPTEIALKAETSPSLLAGMRGYRGCISLEADDAQ